MKETPIIFKTEMVRAILALLKTHTRRLKGLNRVNEKPDDWVVDLQGNIAAFRNIHTGEDILIRCPYGQVGDRLWVRETFYTDNYRRSNGLPVLYKADGHIRSWKPSIFMPKEYARIWLEITGIRVERLQDITPGDAKAEGCITQCDCGECIDSTPRGHFQDLWTSINAKRGYGWDTNPWVWVISFKEVTHE